MNKPKAVRDGGRIYNRFSASRLFEGYSRDQKLFVVEAMLINSATVISTGAFLTGLLLLMGASDFMVGLVSSAGAWSLMLSLASSVIVERVKHKKALLAKVLLVFRLLTTLPVFLPAIMGLGMPTALTAAVMIVAGNAIFSIFNTGFPIFFMDSLPQEGRASFIYARMFWLRLAYAVTFFVMGILLDIMNKSYAGFIVVFMTALAIGIADYFVMNKIQGKEDTGIAPLGNPGEILMSLLKPLRNKHFLHYLIYTFLFFFSLAMSSSFTGLYQLKYLNLSYIFITIYSMFTFAIMILVTRVWAKLEARLGLLKVLVISSLLMALEFFVYTFLTTGTLWLMVLSALFSGLGNGGYWACSLPYRYDLMPAEGKTVYEGWFGFVFGLSGLLGTVTGGQLQKLLPAVSAPFLHFSVFQVIYFISGVLAVATAVVFWMGARRAQKTDLQTK